MNQIPPLVAVTLAICAALAMGFSIQRGGTCMVAAMDQLLRGRSGTRMLALLECSLWTSALGLGALAAGLHFAASPSYAIGWMSVFGGLLLGWGASLNGACVFGSIARIGSRDFNYLLALPGFFLGSFAHHLLFGAAARASPGTDHTGWGGLLAALLLASLAYSILRAWRSKRVARMVFDYRLATISIGFAFVVLAVVWGPWTYTEVFARVAHGGMAPSLIEIALLASLLVGAIIGGINTPRGEKLKLGRASQCLAGGGLMGAGSALIPGGNDNLILVGLPAFQSHAWLAIGAMVLAIAIWLQVGVFWRKLGEPKQPGRVNSP